MTTSEKNGRIPLTILTGFLGAGKTTLLNHILHGDHGLRIAVLINDFGAVNIDAQLVVGVDGEDTVNLANGCICCTIRDDLLRATQQICRRPDPPDYILVETSGVSDPLAVAHTFLHLALRDAVALDAILTVVDAEQIGSVPPENQVLAIDQIGTADIVILNKVDLATESERARAESTIRQIVPEARILPVTFGRVSVELLLGLGLEAGQRPFTRQPHDVHVHPAAHDGHEHDHEHEHEHDDHTLLFHTWHYAEQRPFTFKAIKKAVNALPTAIYRAKGFLYLNEAPDRQCVLQVVGKRVHLVVGEPWGDRPPATSIVFIGQADGVDPRALAAAFDACLHQNQAAQSPLQAAVNWVRDAWALAAAG
jgi:G3E family GTPase